MKILLINTFYYPKFVGGAEISVQILAEELVKAGNEVYVLTSGKHTHITRVNGVVVVHIKQVNIYSSYNGWDKPALIKIIWHLIDSFNLFTYFQFSRILERIAPDIVHTNNIQGLSPSIWAIVKKKNIPLVHTIRDYYLLCHKCNLYNDHKNCETLCMPCKITHGFKNFFFKYPDTYVAISRYIAEKHQRFLIKSEESINVVYNAVQQANAISTEKKNSDKLVFGFIGRLEEDKGIFYLCNEIASLGNYEKQKIRLIIAGKGSEADIRHLHSLLEGVEYDYIGVTKPAEFYTQIHVLIVPSLWQEPFGRVVVESLSYGIPVCMSDSGGLKELHNPDCTWMFTPEKGELSQEIEKIILDRDQIAQKRQQCVDHASKFSVTNYVSSYQNIFNQCV